MSKTTKSNLTANADGKIEGLIALTSVGVTEERKGRKVSVNYGPGHATDKLPAMKLKDAQRLLNRGLIAVPEAK